MNLKNIILFSLVIIIAFACNNRKFDEKRRTIETKEVSSLSPIEEGMAKVGFNEIQYHPNSPKSWRKAWEFYQNIPQLCEQKGVSDAKTISALKSRTLFAVVSPNQYGAFISRDQPTREEAIAIINEYHQNPILDPKTKALIYSYLQLQGMEQEANEFAQKTLSRGAPISENNEIMQKLLAEKERFPPKNKAKDSRIQQEYDNRLALLKKMVK